MKILVVNGPNLNLIGKRERQFYGEDSLVSIEQQLTEKARHLGCQIKFFQSNHEGDLIDVVQQASKEADGILLNAGALTHCGYSLHDALADTGLPVVEVHLSNIHVREEWRQKSVFADIFIGQISGFKSLSYLLGLEGLVSYIANRSNNEN